MSTEILFTERSGAGIAWILEVDHGEMNPDSYHQLYAEFGRRLGFHPPFIEMHTLYPDQHRWGVWWSEHQCPDGCRFTLIVEPSVGQITYSAVRLELRENRDVKSFKTLRVLKLLEGSHFPTPTHK